MASLTLAGENLIAAKQAANAGLKVSRFIFANIPGLDTNAPVDRAAGKPAAARIVYTHAIAAENAGYVNPNQVVYSAQIGSDIGDWDFNWIGLETAENVLFAVAYVPLQQKRRNIPPQQVGNNLTRNFLVVFDGAQALTGVTINANTWQHDFTVRLAGIDERERQANRDMFGRACFFGSALQVEKVGNVYQLKAGTAYVEGIRLERTALQFSAPGAFPTSVWIDVAMQRELSDMVAKATIAYGANRLDYTDSAGVKHYQVLLADLPSAGTITDRRPTEPIVGPLVQHFAARVGDYESLRARATTKDDVGLGNLPNAISDDQETNSSVILATTKAVKTATALIWTGIANIVSGVTVVGKAAKLATARTISLTGDVTGSVSFDGSANAAIAATGVQAGKLKTARAINLTGAITGTASFDGSADVNIGTNISQATEGTIGGAAVATQVQTNAGAADNVFVSPKKLRWGFAASITANGYLAFPTWLGGLVLQWGKRTVANNADTMLFPIAFPNNAFCVICSPDGMSNPSAYEVVNPSDLTLTSVKLWNNQAPGHYWWFAIGN